MSEQLSKIEQRYFEVGTVYCPFCGSDKLDVVCSQETHTTRYSNDVRCVACGHTWHEEFTLQCVYGVRDASGALVDLTTAQPYERVLGTVADLVKLTLEKHSVQEIMDWGDANWPGLREMLNVSAEARENDD